MPVLIIALLLERKGAEMDKLTTVKNKLETMPKFKKELLEAYESRRVVLINVARYKYRVAYIDCSYNIHELPPFIIDYLTERKNKEELVIDKSCDTENSIFYKLTKVLGKLEHRNFFQTIK